MNKPKVMKNLPAFPFEERLKFEINEKQIIPESRN